MPDSARRYTYYKADGFEVWGKEYQNAEGEVNWRLRVFSDQDRRVQTYENVSGEPPKVSRIGESKVIRDAIAAWMPDPPGSQ